jgi:hypothetical protein
LPIPQALAEAALRLLGDEAAWHRPRRPALPRVERYYTHPVMFARYRAVYDQALGIAPAPPAPPGADDGLDLVLEG